MSAPAPRSPLDALALNAQAGGRPPVAPSPKAAAQKLATPDTLASRAMTLIETVLSKSGGDGCAVQLSQLDALTRRSPALVSKLADSLRAVLIHVLADESTSPTPEAAAFATRLLTHHGVELGPDALLAALTALTSAPEPTRTDSFKSLLYHGHPSVAEPALTYLLRHSAALGSWGPHGCVAACLELVFSVWPDAALERHTEPVADALLGLSALPTPDLRAAFGRTLRVAKERLTVCVDKSSRWQAAAAALSCDDADANASRASPLLATPPPVPSVSAQFAHLPLAAKKAAQLDSPSSIGSTPPGLGPPGLGLTSPAFTPGHGLLMSPPAAVRHTGLTPMMTSLRLTPPRDRGGVARSPLISSGGLTARPQLASPSAAMRPVAPIGDADVVTLAAAAFAAETKAAASTPRAARDKSAPGLRAREPVAAFGAHTAAAVALLSSLPGRAARLIRGASPVYVTIGTLLLASALWTSGSGWHPPAAEPPLASSEVRLVAPLPTADPAAMMAEVSTAATWIPTAGSAADADIDGSPFGWEASAEAEVEAVPAVSAPRSPAALAASPAVPMPHALSVPPIRLDGLTLHTSNTDHGCTLRAKRAAPRKPPPPARIVLNPNRYDGPPRIPQHPVCPQQCPLQKPAWLNASEAAEAEAAAAWAAWAALDELPALDCGNHRPANLSIASSLLSVPQPVWTASPSAAIAPPAIGALGIKWPAPAEPAPAEPLTVAGRLLMPEVVPGELIWGETVAGELVWPHTLQGRLVPEVSSLPEVTRPRMAGGLAAEPVPLTSLEVMIEVHLDTHVLPTLEHKPPSRRRAHANTSVCAAAEAPRAPAPAAVPSASTALWMAPTERFIVSPNFIIVASPTSPISARPLDTLNQTLDHQRGWRCRRSAPGGATAVTLPAAPLKPARHPAYAEAPRLSARLAPMRRSSADAPLPPVVAGASMPMLLYLLLRRLSTAALLPPAATPPTCPAAGAPSLALAVLPPTCPAPSAARGIITSLQLPTPPRWTHPAPTVLPYSSALSTYLAPRADDAQPSTSQSAEQLAVLLALTALSAILVGRLGQRSSGGAAGSESDAPPQPMPPIHPPGASEDIETPAAPDSAETSPLEPTLLHAELDAASSTPELDAAVDAGLSGLTPMILFDVIRCSPILSPAKKKPAAQKTKAKTPPVPIRRSRRLKA